MKNKSNRSTAYKYNAKIIEVFGLFLEIVIF